MQRLQKYGGVSAFEGLRVGFGFRFEYDPCLETSESVIKRKLESSEVGPCLQGSLGPCRSRQRWTRASHLAVIVKRRRSTIEKVHVSSGRLRGSAPNSYSDEDHHSGHRECKQDQ
jgi:hypothetical protein